MGIYQDMLAKRLESLDWSKAVRDGTAAKIPIAIWASWQLAHDLIWWVEWVWASQN